MSNRRKSDFFKGNHNISSVEDDDIRKLLISILQNTTHQAFKKHSDNRIWDGKLLRDFLIPSKTTPEYQHLTISCNPSVTGINFKTLNRLNAMGLSFDAILSVFCLVSVVQKCTVQELLVRYVQFLDLRNIDVAQHALPLGFDGHDKALKKLRARATKKNPTTGNQKSNKKKQEVSIAVAQLAKDKVVFRDRILRELRKIHKKLTLIKVDLPHALNQSQRQEMDEILESSSILILIISKAFTSDKASRDTLTTLLSSCDRSSTQFIPIWESVSQFEIATVAPELLSRQRLLTANGFEKIMSELGRAARHALSDQDNSVYEDVLAEKEAGRNFIQSKLSDRARQRGGLKRTSLAVIDIDDMTKINKVHGEAVGNKVIAQVKDLIASCTLEHHDSGRCGDDTFYLAVYDQTPTQAISMFERLITSISRFNWNAIAHELRVTCSLGYACFHNQSDFSLPLAIRASLGMNYAKENGGNCVAQGPDEMTNTAFTHIDTSRLFS